MKPTVFMIGFSPNRGGVETYIKNLCQYLDKDFEIILRQPVMKINGKVWNMPVNRHNPIAYHKFWTQFFRENRFDVIYFNTCDIVSIDMLRFAKTAGIPVRIIHSHSTGNQISGNNLKSVLHKIQEHISRRSLHRYATHMLACSRSAGEWMFDGKPYILIKNGIDIEKYRYSEIQVKQAPLNLIEPRHPVFVCLGRLSSEKNPLFTLKIFKSICNMNEHAQCLFIGEGEYHEQLLKEIRQNELESRIIMTGNVNNVCEWLCYADCLIMPSLFEGLPFALVEAQATGLHCLVSTGVSKESNITGLVKYMDLDIAPEIWAQQALKLAKKPRIDKSQYLINEGFSMKQSAEKVKEIINNAITRKI